MIDIRRVLTVLASKRPIFHSEADFQHALAWEIHKQWPSCSMRLEVPWDLDQCIYLDIWVKGKGTILTLELKYKTRILNVEVGEETFNLSTHAAYPQARYDFLRDIQRLEKICHYQNDIIGYAIFLTNDDLYWKLPGNRRTYDAQFRIHQGRNLTGELRWAPEASKGTMRGSSDAILLKDAYKMNWQDYSEPSKASYGKFRYLLVKVG